MQSTNEICVMQATYVCSFRKIIKKTGANFYNNIPTIERCDPDYEGAIMIESGGISWTGAEMGLGADRSFILVSY